LSHDNKLASCILDEQILHWIICATQVNHTSVLLTTLQSLQRFTTASDLWWRQQTTETTA